MTVFRVEKYVVKPEKHEEYIAIMKKWADYIKKNKLQDPVNRRMINADDNLKEVFGGKKQVTMFEMTKLVNKHLKD